MPTECTVCGWPLAGSTYVQPWEDGDNENGYFICSHCKGITFDFSDDD